MWPAASSRLRGAAMVEEVHNPKTADAASSLAGIILVSDDGVRVGGLNCYLV
jgi:hypothetical protein